jgi:hypothetical protein
MIGDIVFATPLQQSRLGGLCFVYEVRQPHNEFALKENPAWADDWAIDLRTIPSGWGTTYLVTPTQCELALVYRHPSPEDPPLMVGDVVKYIGKVPVYHSVGIGKVPVYHSVGVVTYVHSDPNPTTHHSVQLGAIGIFAPRTDLVLLYRPVL